MVDWLLLGLPVFSTFPRGAGITSSHFLLSLAFVTHNMNKFFRREQKGVATQYMVAIYRNKREIAKCELRERLGFPYFFEFLAIGKIGVGEWFIAFYVHDYSA